MAPSATLSPNSRQSAIDPESDLSFTNREAGMFIKRSFVASQRPSGNWCSRGGAVVDTYHGAWILVIY